MKIKLLLLLLATGKLWSQTITFPFIKSSITYNQTKLADELYKMNFYLANKKMEVVSNKMLEGGQYFSNEKERKLRNGEIGVISNKTGDKRIIELSFSYTNKTYADNYDVLYNQIKSNFPLIKYYFIQPE